MLTAYRSRLNRVRHMSVLLLMVLGTFASSVGVILSSQTTYAAGEQSLITSDAYNAVLKNIAGRTFTKCKNFKNEITTADAAAGKLFGDSGLSGTAHVGFVVEPKDGKVGCGDQNDTPAFLKLLGAYGYTATNQEPFLLSLGYTKTATGYKRTTNNTADFFKYTTYDKLPASTLYAMAYTEFTSAACSAQQNSSGSVTLKLVYQSGGSSTASTADVKYSYGITDRRSFPSGADITCGDMAKRINDNAAGYATYLTDFIASEKRKTLIDGPVGDYCSAKYPSGVSSVVVQSCLNDTYAAYQACWAKIVDSGQAPIGSENAARDPSTAEKVKCMQTKLGGTTEVIQALVAAIDSTAVTDVEGIAPAGTDEAGCTASGQTWDETSGTCVDNGAACTGGSLGWVLCPVATMIQGLIQAIATMIGNILEINPIGGSSDLLTVWRIFVGFANLLLVIGFLIVIFSQATSVGLSAYGIKKMLPRIIAAAILINLSYFICTIAIDISNILGASVRGIVNAVPIDVETSTGTFNTGATWASNLTAIALVGVTGWLAVAGYAAFVIPMLIAGALAVVSIFLMIAIRQALVLLLVIAAPLAFAAMILPNTEQLFTKWRKLFINMLIMYPVIMFLMYGSKLVGQILQVANTTQGDDTSKMMTQMVVFVILTIAPFAGLYMYLKNSNKLMSMATGVVSKLGSGAQGWGKNWASQKQKNSKYSQKWANRDSAVNEAAARRAYSQFQRDPARYTRFMGRDAQQIMNAKVATANEKIENEAVNQSIKGLPYYNPTAYDGGPDGKGPNDRTRMASDAYAAIKAGDMVKAHAIATVAAKAGADEFTDFHTALQDSMMGTDGKWTPQRSEQMKEINGRVLATTGGDLRPKNMGLVSALERSFDTDENGKPVEGVYIKDEMVSPGMNSYYKAMGAEQLSVFSTKAAQAAAGSVTDESLRDVIENANIRGRMKKGTRIAYEDAYITRFGKLPYQRTDAGPDAAPPADGSGYSI